ncbi:hypothetical protein NQ318_018145, partial [Aromia moschata]
MVAVLAFVTLTFAQDYYDDPPRPPRPAPSRIQTGYSGSSAPKAPPITILKQIDRANSGLALKEQKKDTPQKVVNIVENLSSQVFDKEELNLLNKGLKFGLPASGGALEEVVAGVECAIQHLPDSSRGYVDDIFAVFDTKAISLDNFVAKLNNRFPTIKFTYEVEHNEQLPFLDVLVIRNSENKLEFDVYRKETATLRYIPNDSHHPFQHKMANTDNSKFASLPYEPKFTRGLDKIFKNININLVYNSKNKLQTLLGNPKDKINNNEKSGIYEISCITKTDPILTATKAATVHSKSKPNSPPAMLRENTDTSMTRAKCAWSNTEQRNTDSSLPERASPRSTPETTTILSRHVLNPPRGNLLLLDHDLSLPRWIILLHSSSNPLRNLHLSHLVLKFQVCKVLLTGAAPAPVQHHFDFGPPARSAPRPKPRPAPVQFAQPTPIEEDYEPAPAPRPAPRVTYAEPAPPGPRHTAASFGPGPRPAASRPAPPQFEPAPRPSSFGPSRPAAPAGRGGILDQLSKDYALPSGSAPSTTSVSDTIG